MAASDTVVGIVGAVLLAGIMVTVFVYEYNNTPATPDAGPGTPEAKMGAFKAAHANLNATEDLDVDGTANYNDTDMDGNGVADLNQTGDLVVRKPLDGSVGPPAPPSQTSSSDQSIAILTGASNVTLKLTYTTTIPVLPAGGPTPSITISFLDPAGEPVAASTTSDQQASGNSVTVTLEVRDVTLAPGTYTIRVVATVAPATAYHIDAAVDYGPAHAAPAPDLNPR